MSFKSLAKYVALALIVFLISFAGAAFYERYYMPQRATINATFYQLDGESWTNSTWLDWSKYEYLEPNVTYWIPVQVNNTSPLPITIRYIVPNPPANWTFTYTANNTVLQAYTGIMGNLTVTPDWNATGSHEWDSYWDALG